MHRHARFISAALACLALAPPAMADRPYDNVDSVRVGRLTYILALDRHVYAFSDSIYISTRVANRTSEIETLEVRSQCRGYGFSETWCLVDSICPAPNPIDLCLCAGPGYSWNLEIPPGEKHIADYVYVPVTRGIESGVSVGRGAISMCPPWSPVVFDLEVAYERQPPVAVRPQTWSRVKWLFR